MFYFGFAVLLYDMWLLVDLIVQVSLDIGHRYKPRVTAKRFLNLARKQFAGIG
jgi:IS4 transposase